MGKSKAFVEGPSRVPYRCRAGSKPLVDAPRVSQISSVIGRFSSPDWSASPEAVPYSSLDDPQSLNLYSYGRNNPLSHSDPDGIATSMGNIMVLFGVSAMRSGLLRLLKSNMLKQTTSGT